MRDTGSATCRHAFPRRDAFIYFPMSEGAGIVMKLRPCLPLTFEIEIAARRAGSLWHTARG